MPDQKGVQDQNKASDKASADASTGTGTKLSEEERGVVIRGITDRCLRLFVSQSEDGIFSTTKQVYLGRDEDGELTPMPLLSFGVKMSTPAPGLPGGVAHTSMTVVAAMGDDAGDFITSAVEWYGVTSQVVKEFTRVIAEQREHEQDEAAIKTAERFKA